MKLITSNPPNIILCITSTRTPYPLAHSGCITGIDPCTEVTIDQTTVTRLPIIIDDLR